jgi:hypothetical protein
VRQTLPHFRQDAAVDYSKSNTSPILKLFLSRLDETRFADDASSLKARR